jgi:hypothetical protein
MLKFFQVLLINGLIVAGIGIPVALIGLPIVLITGHWDVAHFGLWMMGGGVVAAALGGFGLYYFGMRQVRKMFNRFIANQPTTPEEVIDVEQVSPPSELPRH